MMSVIGTSLAGVAAAQTLPLIGGDQSQFGGGMLTFDGGDGFSQSDPFRASMLQDGSYSIQASNLAMNRSKNSYILQFAQLELNEQVSLAAALGATATNLVPLRPDQAQRLAELQGATRRDFDRLYVEDQIAAHNRTLAVTTP